MAAEGQAKEGVIPNQPILIMGVGNILLSDEGVGVRVIEDMQSLPLPDNVELLDGGTSTLDRMDIIADRDKVIIVDAVKGGGEPGAVYRFRPDDVEMPRQYFTSVHQVGLLETLSMARLAGCLPRDITIFGIEPKEIDWGMELSPEVSAAIPKVIELIMRELR